VDVESSFVLSDKNMNLKVSERKLEKYLDLDG
jgi:hypothetical protein